MTKHEQLLRLIFDETEALSLPLPEVIEELRGEQVDPQDYITEVRRQLAALREQI